MIDVGLWFTYILVIVTAIAAMGFSLVHILKRPAESKWMLIGLGSVVLFFLVGYMLTDGQAFIDVNGKILAGATTSRIVGSGLYTLYILFGAAVVGIVATEVKSMLKI